MEGEDQKSSKGSATGVGIFCAVAGAIAGAVGYYMLEKNQREAVQSKSEKVYCDGACAICLSDIKEPKVLPCGHSFHDTCVSGHTNNGQGMPKCPICVKKSSE